VGKSLGSGDEEAVFLAEKDAKNSEDRKNHGSCSMLTDLEIRLTLYAVNCNDIEIIRDIGLAVC
jgi:hypothetical protein